MPLMFTSLNKTSIDQIFHVNGVKRVIHKNHKFSCLTLIRQVMLNTKNSYGWLFPFAHQTFCCRMALAVLLLFVTSSAPRFEWEMYATARCPCDIQDYRDRHLCRCYSSCSMELHTYDLVDRYLFDRCNCYVYLAKQQFQATCIIQPWINTTNDQKVSFRENLILIPNTELIILSEQLYVNVTILVT